MRKFLKGLATILGSTVYKFAYMCLFEVKVQMFAQYVEIRAATIRQTNDMIWFYNGLIQIL